MVDKDDKKTNGDGQENAKPAAAQDAQPVQAEPVVTLAEYEAKVREYEEKILRLRADFDNYRKKTFRDLAETRTSTRTEAVIPMLNVLDHFRLAVDAAEKDHDIKVVKDGVRMILAEFQKSLDDLGVKEVSALGKDFDPSLHEAISHENSDQPEGRVVKEWKKGYMMGDKLLKPAVVVVSSGPAAKKE